MKTNPMRADAANMPQKKSLSRKSVSSSSILLQGRSEALFVDIVRKDHTSYEGYAHEKLGYERSDNTAYE